MLAPLHPAYPSEEDIQYGLWLKRFAMLLPDYADQYDLSILQLLEVQSIAVEYLDLLIASLQRTSAHISGVPTGSPPLACELLSCHEYAQLVPHLIAKIVTQVRQHSGYTTCDGQALGLYAIALPQD